jgi:hypothetical protein
VRRPVSATRRSGGAATWCAPASISAAP